MSWSAVASSRNTIEPLCIPNSRAIWLASPPARCVSRTVLEIVSPPRSAFVTTILGGRPLMRTPAPSSSVTRARRLVCSGSIMNRIRSTERTTDSTSRPRPRPLAAPGTSPGMSRIWIEAPPQRSIPGMIETVVKS